MRVLLVEDSLKLATWLTLALKEHGFAVDTIHDGAQADALLRTERFDAVLLDLSLPSMDGLVVLQRLREAGVTTPVIVLTARGDLEDRVKGLNLGADDYLTKPFELSELEARLHAVIRRAYGVSAPVVQLGPLQYEISQRTFTLDDRVLNLRLKEHAVLEVLLLRLGKVVSKTDLRDCVFSVDAAAGEEAVEVHIHRLREQLADSGLTIVTLRGLGYLLEAA